MVARRTTESGVALKRIHPVESFRMMGWDLPHWSSEAFKHVDIATLNSLASNMWSMFHFVPLCIAAVGAVDFDHLLCVPVASNKEDDTTSALGSESEELSFACQSRSSKSLCTREGICVVRHIIGLRMCFC